MPRRSIRPRIVRDVRRTATPAGPTVARRIVAALVDLMAIGVVLATGLYLLYRYDQQTLHTALAGQRGRDRQAQAAALATASARATALRVRERLADTGQQAAALATARVAIPTQVAQTAVAAAHATSTAGASARATAVAGYAAAATATARAQPGYASVCTATDYSQSTGRCTTSDRRIAVGDAGNGRLVVDARNTPSARAIVVAVAQTQPDGSLASVNTTSATVSGDAGGVSWPLSRILPANFFGSVNLGQYHIDVLIDGRAVPRVYVTIYH